MIKSLFALVLVLSVTNSFAAVKIEEELYVLDSPELTTSLRTSGESRT